MVSLGVDMGWWQRLFGGGEAQAQPDTRPCPDAVIAEMSAPTLLNFASLPAIAEQRTTDYAQAEPFPHILLEDFLSTSALDRLLAEFPGPEEQLSWRKIRAESDAAGLVQYNKLGMPVIDEMPPAIRELVWELNSGTFIRFLELLTGIDQLIVDPKLRGGGIHQVMPGGVLGVHADFTNHADYQLDRRLNVLIYLNRDWPEEYGGDLELWSTDMSHCVRKIRPLAGRCVIFNTSADSFHGHPRPLTCPVGVTRKSIALYYYTTRRARAPARRAETNRAPGPFRGRWRPRRGRCEARSSRSRAGLDGVR